MIIVSKFPFFLCNSLFRENQQKCGKNAFFVGVKAV